MNDLAQKTVALVGRPNVGKSTLFNRLIGRREAIETPIPGTTRDRLYGEVFWRNQRFNLIDVAGIEFGTKGEISKSAQEGVELAINSADLLIFLVDWTDPDNETDKAIARILRKTSKATILAINKADNLERQQDVEKFKRLGNFEIVPISAISGKNTGEMLDKIVEKLSTNSNIGYRIPKQIQKNTNSSFHDTSLVSLAILGRPNVGKSTLLNSIIGEKRAIVSEEPGTTRDTFSVHFWHKNKQIKIYDTAGIRRPGKIQKDTIESFSVLRSWRAMQDANVIIVVVDAIEGLVAGDTHILGQAKETGKGVILAMNKIDAWTGDKNLKMAETLSLLQQKLNFMPWLPVVFISAKDGDNINSLLNQVIKVFENRETVIKEQDLMSILEFARESNPQIDSVTALKQKKTSPPVFEVYYKGKTKPHQTQLRYLENKIRDVFPMEGTPVFVDIAQRNPKTKRN